MDFCRAKPAEIKVIDFGSACEEGRTVYSYIQVYILISLGQNIIRLYYASLLMLYIQDSGIFSFFSKKISACRSYLIYLVLFLIPEPLLQVP